MHKDLEKAGLVVISLSVDEMESKDAALKFLKKQNATFTNFILEDTEENKEKTAKNFEFNAPPIVHVYDRTGKKVKTFDADVKEEEIDKLIKELLNAK